MRRRALALLDALVAPDALLADEAVVAFEALAIVGELVVGQAVLVHPRARLVQLGLGALARGDLLGLSARAARVDDCSRWASATSPRRRTSWRSRDLARMRGMQDGDEREGDQDDDDDGDDGSGGHGLSSRFAIGPTRRSRRETVDP